MEGIQLPKINDEKIFEQFCLQLYKRIIKDDNAQKNGRKGQKQFGIDIFGRKNNSLNWIGIQCKVRRKALNEKEIRNEVKKAHKFNPKISKYIIVTTLDRDEKVQGIVRTLTEENIRKKSFPIVIDFWQDLEDEIFKEENRDILYQFYKHFFLNSNEIGNSIGKLLDLNIGISGKQDTCYELLIGKIIHKKKYGKKETGIGYYTDLFFVMNLNDRKFSTFTMPCHFSDFEETFVTKRDAYILCLWLNSLNDMDNLIDCSEIHYEFSISLEEYKDFLKNFKN